MSVTSWRSAVVALVISGGIGLSARATDAVVAYLPFEFGPRGAVVVRGLIDGSGPLRLLLDTGSSHTVISTAAADRLGLRRVAQSEIFTSTGREFAQVVTIGRLVVGPIDRVNMAAIVAPVPTLEYFGKEIDGAIGQDLLADLDYTIDYRKRQVRWTPSEPSDERQRGTLLNLVEEEGRFLADLPQRAPGKNDKHVLLVPDTGASQMVLYSPVPSTFDLQQTSLAAELQSVVGSRLASLMMMPTLRVGHLTLRDQPVIVVTRPRAASADGLLPLHLFSSVSFSARRHTLIVR